MLLTFSVMPVVVLSYGTLNALEGYFQDTTLESLEGLARAKGQAIEQFMTDRVRQVERISSIVVTDVEQIAKAPGELPPTQSGELPDPPEVRDDTIEPMAPPALPPETQAPEAVAEAKESKLKSSAKKQERKELGEQARTAQESLRKTLGLILSDQIEYEELLVMDLAGTVLVSTFHGHEGKTASDIEYFQNGLRTTYVQPVFLSPITQRNTMVVSTPIKDESQRVVGVLAARLNLDTFFDLISDSTGLGRSGETVAARKVDSEFVFMAPTRHDDQAALSRKIEANSTQFRPLQEAVRGQTGSGLATDYRSVAVFAAWQPIPSLDWGLVVKVDADESEKVVRDARSHSLLLMLGILVLIVFASVVVSKTLVAPLRELKDATDKISKGDLDVKLAIRSGDEVGELADSFERMVGAIKFFKEDKEPNEGDENEGDENEGDENEGDENEGDEEASS